MKKHKKAWFEHRIGKFIWKQSEILSQVKVESFAHAYALYLSQTEKKYKYYEL